MKTGWWNALLTIWDYAGAIHNGENTILYQGIESELTQWKLPTTTTVRPTWYCQIVNLRINLIPQPQSKANPGHIALPSLFSVPPRPGI